MSVMDKKSIELTEADKQALAKPVGIEGLAYPMIMYKTGPDGEVEQKLGVIDTLAESMTLYTERPVEEVQGKLFREMPIPSMLLMLRDLMDKQAPDSESKLFSVFGDPAFGKSFLFKSFASLVHPKGAISVDCGGMNMREIFFRTVIDYGAGVQEVLNNRLAEGKVPQTALDYMKTALGDAVSEVDGKLSVDWDKIGAVPKAALEAVDTVDIPDDAPEEKRKELALSNDKAMQEVKDQYLNSAIQSLNKVYELAGINAQNNSFGIKTVPGEFFQAYWEGRPLFLDEFNKSKRGTLDAMQTVLQFLTRRGK
jgi:hypothetical protein